jgi:hypothetical protein
MTITLKELKEFLKDLPETDPLGYPYEVWIETSKGLSNGATTLHLLNSREEGSDIILSALK